MFFAADRANFFRPVGGKHRELIGACLVLLYERLHGPSADYSSNLTRDGLRDLLLPAIQAHKSEAVIDFGTEDEFAATGGDDQLVAAAVIRAVVKDGWLETFSDRAGLITAYRFTRAGKLFAEALWAFERPRARSRQRNMRSCRNALEAALRNVDAYDLIDAYDYAEKVISDLSEGVDYFQDLVRRLMVEASQTPWDEFMDFLDRFEREFKKQLVADNVDRHRQSIRETLGRLRSIEEGKYRAFAAQLTNVARWAEKESSGTPPYDWLLDRVEELVEAACTTKQPELIKAMNAYMRRATSIVQQALQLRSGQQRHAYLRAITHVAELPGHSQTEALERLGRCIAAAEVRLLDPASFRLRSLAQRRKALTVTAPPRVTREARLAAAVASAEAAAFSFSNDEVMACLRQELRLTGRAFRLSALPLNSAPDLLRAMQAVEAVRGDISRDLRAVKLPTKLATPYYIANDYQIEPNHDAD